MSVLAQHILQLGHLVPVILVNEALGLHREVLQQDRIADFIAQKPKILFGRNATKKI